RKLADFRHHHYKTRFDHSLEVAWHSFLISRRLSLDCDAIVRGALLHDLFFYDWLHEGPRLHGFRHPWISLKNARKVTTLSNKEKDIIIKHMWPLTIIPPRYPESWVVCFVDTYCTVKDYVTVNRQKRLEF
ncbi:MAG: phosphohydrolase, partial [Thermodesulfobacteriota bacterium]|nr:phosphohydrolase [Thermodesulfobacteriota bacterium]